MRYLLTFALLLFATGAFAQTEREIYPVYWQGDAAYKIGGEHTPIVWKDIFNADRRTNANDSINSRWIWIGYDQNATVVDSQNTNRLLFDAAPSIFNLLLRGYLFNTGAENADTVRLDRARFEVARDTTLIPLMNPDTSSTFVINGAANRSDYGIWTFEDPITTGDSLGLIYPLRVFGGGWLRIWVIVTGTDDTADWYGDLETPAGGR